MNPEVQKAIEQKNAEYELMKAAKEQNEKLKILDKVGLYKKEYVEPKGQYGYSKEEAEMYPITEIEGGVLKRYRKVYPEITDEEYEALKNTAELLPDEKTIPDTIDVDGFQSRLAKFMMVLAIILYIAFFILGFVLGNNTVAGYYSTYREFSFGSALLYWVIGIFSGTMMLGFAHIVDHLYKQTILLSKINH